MTVKELEGVSKERILKELSGMLAAPHFVDKGLPLMFKLGIDKTIPGLSELFEDLKTCLQTPKWHSEGGIFNADFKKEDGTVVEKFEAISGADLAAKFAKVDKDIECEITKIITCGNAFDHTMLVMEEMAKQLFKEDGTSDFDEHTRFVMMMAAMLHDCGKPASGRKNGKKNPDDLWCKTKDHDIVGEPIAFDFCKNLGMTNKDCDDIAWLVKHHMRAHQIEETKSKCKRWRLISHPLFDKLVMLARADERGCRKTKRDEWRGIDHSFTLPEIYELVGKPMPERILTGDDIIARGFEPGPTFKKALDKAYEFQIDKGITDKESLFKNVKGIVKGN